MKLHVTRFICMLIAATQIPCYGGEVIDEDYGYQFATPEGWVRIPDRIVQQMTNLVVEDPDTLQYDHAFQPRNETDWFGSSYILVQNIPYDKVEGKDVPTEEDIKQLVSILSGYDLNELIESRGSSLSDYLVDDVSSLREPVLDNEKHRAFWYVSMRMKENINLMGLSALFFGSDAVISITYWCDAHEWEKSEYTRLKLIDSFKFRSDKAYPKSTQDSLTGSASKSKSESPDIVKKQSEGEYPFIYILVGVLVTLLAVVSTMLLRAKGYKGKA